MIERSRKREYWRTVGRLAVVALGLELGLAALEVADAALAAVGDAAVVVVAARHRRRRHQAVRETVAERPRRHADTTAAAAAARQLKSRYK